MHKYLAELLYSGNYVSMSLSVLIGYIGPSNDTGNPKLHFTRL